MRRLAPAFASVLLVPAISAGVSGCGASPAAAPSAECTYYTAFDASPASGTADHSASSPGNQVKFSATEAPAAKGTECALPQYILLVQPQWTSSEPLNVSISSAKDDTNGTATCTGSTAGAVTLTATAADFNGTSNLTTTVSLTCK